MRTLTLKLPPGVYRNGTEYQTKGRFRDASLMRWREGRLGPIGGWRERSASTVTGYARAILTWRDNSSNRRIGIGTHSHLYAMNEAGTLSDITPLRATVTLAADPITTSNGLTTVTIAHTAHGASAGDYVVFSGAAAVGGITISGEYEIITVPGANSYTITHSAQATSTATGGGAAVEAKYLIATGRPDAVLRTGYGYGPYGAYAYGVARPDLGVYSEATVWALDTWGEYLLGCASTNGTIYEWTLDTAVRAAAVSGAPTSCRGVVVTDERFVLALGAGGNPRKVQWCDRENNTSWTPSATSQAGDLELQTPGQIQCAVRVGGSTLILTDVDAHVARYQGLPYVYGFERVESGCGIVSQNAACVIGPAAVWMGRGSFYIYDGFVRGLDSDVSDYVFSRLNIAQASKVSKFHNSAFNEVWWFYPSSGSNEVDSYVYWNYRENHWNIGTMARTCGTEKGAFSTPLLVGTDGLVYEHEVGFDYDDDAPYAETGPLELGDGERVLTLLRMIPDEATQGDVTALFKTRFYPNATETTSADFSMANPTSIRVTGRQFKVRFTGARLADFRVGDFRLEVVEGGRR